MCASCACSCVERQCVCLKHCFSGIQASALICSIITICSYLPGTVNVWTLQKDLLGNQQTPNSNSRLHSQRVQHAQVLPSTDRSEVITSRKTIIHHKLPLFSFSLQVFKEHSGTFQREANLMGRCLTTNKNLKDSCHMCILHTYTKFSWLDKIVLFICIDFKTFLHQNKCIS